MLRKFSFWLLWIISQSSLANTHYQHSTLWENIQKDYSHYYTPHVMKETATLLFAAGIFANTGLDAAIEHKWQRDIRSAPVWEVYHHQHSRTFWDHFLQPVDDFAGMDILIPLYISAALVRPYMENAHWVTISEWGERSLRSVVLGGPQQFLWTHLLGAHRPHDPEGSRWRLFKGKRGVSGHTYYGAIPLLNAAMMLDEHPFLKGTLYVASTLPGLARINEDKHYFSQVLSAWGLAYLATRTVQEVSQKSSPSLVSWGFLPLPESVMLTAVISF